MFYPEKFAADQWKWKKIGFKAKTKNCVFSGLMRHKDA